MNKFNLELNFLIFCRFMNFLKSKEYTSSEK
jgi:hypothetical protein